MWGPLDDITVAYQALSNASMLDVVEEVMPTVKQYVTILYDCTSTCMNVHVELMHRGIYSNVKEQIQMPYYTSQLSTTPPKFSQKV